MQTSPPPQRRSSLELTFSEVLELQPADVAALSALRRLTGLHLVNVSVPAGLDLASLAAGLPGLRALTMVQNSKVAPLLHGDAALESIAALGNLRDLVLRGRMCAVGDAGLLALKRLTKLRSLAIGWVPWQSQVSQVRRVMDCINWVVAPWVEAAALVCGVLLGVVGPIRN